ncbi:MAG: magnesium/cobalt transporter CorA [Patescibacteria group bacterium]
MKKFYEINLKTGEQFTRPIAQIEQALRTKNTYVWLDIDQETAKAEAQKLLGQAFHFHAWTIKQSFSSETRAKLEEHDDYLFVVTPSLVKSKALESEITNLSIFLGKNFVVSVHPKPIQAIIDVAEQLPKQDAELRKQPDQLLYYLMTEIVDDYRPMIEKIDQEVDYIEDNVDKHFNENIQTKIFRARRVVLGLRRPVGPLREVVSILTNRQVLFVSPKMRLMFRSTYDHILRIYDELETFRELLSSAMESYRSQISNRLNEIMKILSIVATIMMPLTLISGIWGTNFRNLPGIYSSIGFWIMIASMLIIGSIMIWFFRRRRWF